MVLHSTNCLSVECPLNTMQEYHTGQSNWPPQTHTHTTLTYICTHTTLTSQHALHLLPQNFHFRVAFHSNDYLTDLPQSSIITLLQEACMQELVLLRCIRVLHDGVQITITNNALMYEFMYNGIGIHSGNKLGPKVSQDLFSCTDREEMQHMHLASS